MAEAGQKLLACIGSIRAAARHPIRRTIGAAWRLADSLGEDHDLALLADHLRISATDNQNEPVTELLDAIERRRRRLRRRALKIGAALYAEAPAVMEKRLRRHWQQWRTGRELDDWTAP